MSNETIADIVAELRRCPTSTALGCMVSLLCNRLADRIETAWKREKAEIEASALAAGGIVEASRHKQVGNSAAMRAALECVKRLFDGRIMFQPAIRKAHKAVEAALAAPPMNCNRFTTWEAALSAFREETRNSKPLELWLGCEIQAFAIWLFATATEQKGGNDGSK